MRTFRLLTSRPDLYGDTIDLRQFVWRNPVSVMKGKELDSLPIGTARIRRDGDSLLADVEFSEENPDGDLAARMVDEGTLRACDIRYVGNEIVSVHILSVGNHPDAVLMKCVGCQPVKKNLDRYDRCCNEVSRLLSETTKRDASLLPFVREQDRDIAWLRKLERAAEIRELHDLKRATSDAIRAWEEDEDELDGLDRVKVKNLRDAIRRAADSVRDEGASQGDRVVG